MESENIETILICECSSIEHQIAICYDHQDDEVFLQIHLTKRSFYYRLIYGIKYIFGYQCRYGAFDEFVFKKQHVSKLKYLVRVLENIN